MQKVLLKIRKITFRPAWIIIFTVMIFDVLFTIIFKDSMTTLEHNPFQLFIINKFGIIPSVILRLITMIFSFIIFLNLHKTNKECQFFIFRTILYTLIILVAHFMLALQYGMVIFEFFDEKEALLRS